MVPYVIVNQTTIQYDHDVPFVHVCLAADDTKPLLADECLSLAAGCRSPEGSAIKPKISNVMDTKPFWNNLHQVRAKWKCYCLQTRDP